MNDAQRLEAENKAFNELYKKVFEMFQIEDEDERKKASLMLGVVLKGIRIIGQREGYNVLKQRIKQLIKE